jgi:hypothetical protein
MTGVQLHLPSEPEVGGVGVVGAPAGASGKVAVAGLAGMALPWAAAAPGCCWGGGDVFSLVVGGGGASPPAQQQRRNRNQHMHQFISCIDQTEQSEKVKAESSMRAERVRAGSYVLAASGEARRAAAGR